MLKWNYVLNRLTVIWACMFVLTCKSDCMCDGHAWVYVHVPVFCDQCLKRKIFYRDWKEENSTRILFVTWLCVSIGNEWILWIETVVKRSIPYVLYVAMPYIIKPVKCISKHFVFAYLRLHQSFRMMTAPFFLHIRFKKDQVKCKGFFELFFFFENDERRENTSFSVEHTLYSNKYTVFLAVSACHSFSVSLHGYYCYYHLLVCCIITAFFYLFLLQFYFVGIQRSQFLFIVTCSNIYSSCDVLKMR